MPRKANAGEPSQKVLTVAGPLARGVEFTLRITGPAGSREIDRLVKRLEQDREFLTEAS